MKAMMTGEKTTNNATSKDVIKANAEQNALPRINQ
jgi:hypothetical protein